MLRTPSWPAWTLYVRPGDASTLAATNPASAENMKDLDERYYIIGDMSESFQDQCRYLNSVAILGGWKQKRVRHMMKKNVIFFRNFSKILKIFEIYQEVSEMIEKSF